MMELGNFIDCESLLTKLFSWVISNSKRIKIKISLVLEGIGKSEAMKSKVFLMLIFTESRLVCPWGQLTNENLWYYLALLGQIRTLCQVWSLEPGRVMDLFTFGFRRGFKSLFILQAPDRCTNSQVFFIEEWAPQWIKASLHPHSRWKRWKPGPTCPTC